MKGRTPTKAEREWLNAICQIGCIVCRNEYGVYSPACPHHMDGKTRPNAHFRTIPLCGRHHQTGGDGVAFHATGRKVWEGMYGREEQLLEQVKEIVNGDYRD